MFKNGIIGYSNEVMCFESLNKDNIDINLLNHKINNNHY